MAIEDDDSESGWRDYRRYVVEELRRINVTIALITDKIEKFRQDDIALLKTDIALLKFQAGIFGALGGTIFGALATAIMSLIFKSMR